MIHIMYDMMSPDYTEYVRRCRDEKTFPLPIGEFACQFGMMLTARVSYPGQTDSDAIAELNREALRQHEELVRGVYAGKASLPGCGSCGGGQVR